MRIALVPSSYAPDVGGVEELTARLAQRLLAGTDTVEVWTIRHPPSLPDRDTISGVAVRRFAMPLPRSSPLTLAALPWRAWQASAMLGRAAAGLRPQIIHVQCFSANGVYATWLARRLRVPLVITLQGETVMDDVDVYEHSLTLRTGLRWALRRADAVTACSQYVLEDAWERFGLLRQRGEVIPNGVEPREAVVPQALELPFARFVLGLGRVVPKKGFDLLLCAFARIAAAHPDLGLVLAGEGSEREALMDAARGFGLGDRVAFPGALGRAQVAWAMGAAELFVLPSRVEPFGIVVLEALRAGCPTIASSRGGASDVVRDGLDGLLADPADTAALAEALDRILSDPALAQRLRCAGPARAAAFSWEAIAGRYRELYEGIAR